MRTPLIALFTLVCMLASGGCTPKESTPFVELNGARYAVELAETPEQRDRGLMFRRELAQNTGMLFIHSEDDILSYWMKNTYIALDILYFDRNLRLVSAHVDVPPCGEQAQCPIYPSAGPARYVLELNAGQAKQLKLKVGDVLRVSGVTGMAKPDDR